MIVSQSLTINWNSAIQLLPVLYEFYEKKSKNQDIDLKEAVKKAAGAVGVSDIESFAKEAIQNQLQGALGDERGSQFANVVAAMGEPVFDIVVEFAKGNKDPRFLLNKLNSIYLGSLVGLESALEEAAGFKIPNELKAILGKYATLTMSVYCFAAAYSIYRKAAEDAALAREHRIEIERLCEESIAKLKAHRREMELMVSEYMLDRLLPFASGVRAMDEAVLANDDDGYIEANVEIWALLGRDAQYKNTTEFNDLMMSDTAFKL